MKFGFVYPFGDVTHAVACAQEAEQAGWDGFFVWEAIYGIDAWVTLGAIAARTQRLRLGTMISPLPRMKPWKLASEAVTLDILSNGRAVVALGLGAVDTGYAEFGEVLDRKTRAELLDEGIDILTGLWSGQPVEYTGKHYTLKPSHFLPPPRPVQQPRIPIWCVGAWPQEKSMRRVLKCDGLLPSMMNAQKKFVEFEPDDVRAMRTYVEQRRQLNAPFDIVLEGETPGDDSAQAAAKVRRWEAAGATWWMETRWEVPREGAEGRERVMDRVRQGPPTE